MVQPHRTDSRSLMVRKVSVQMRLIELRAAVSECERTEAELDIAIEQAEYDKERRTHAAE